MGFDVRGNLGFNHGVMSEEEKVWRGSPSQWLNAWVYVICGLGSLLVLMGVYFSLWVGLLWLPMWAWGGWRYLQLRCMVYEVTTQRLRLFQGVLSQTIEEVELYRVKDMTIRRPLWLRLLGLANLELHTSDRSLPELLLPAIAQVEQLRETLRTHVELLRDRKRVREVDFDGADGDSMDFV